MVKKETYSWKRFISEVIPSLVEGRYGKELEERYINEFKENLTK